MNRKADAILGATVRLFLADGARKASMDDIAENAGVSKVTIYKYFTDKNGLYREAGRRLLSGYAGRLEGVVSSGESPSERLRNFIDVVCAFTDGGEYKLCRELTAYDDGPGNESISAAKAYADALSALIDEGLRNGVFQKGLDREMIFHYVDMGVVYYQQCEAYRDRMRGDADFRERNMRFLIGNIFAGEKTPSVR